MLKQEKYIKQFLAEEALKESGRGIHYRGPCDMLRHNGRVYTRPIGAMRGFKEEYRHHCYRESHKKAIKRVPATKAHFYVEGYTLDGTYKPFRHAWLVDLFGNILDITYKGREDTILYWGVVLPTPLIKEAINASGKYGVFWGPNKPWIRVEKLLAKYKVI